MLEKSKKERNRIRQEFLLTFFDKNSGYSEKEINGFWLIKQWNGNQKIWQVAIYTKESFRKYNYLRNKNR